MNYLAYARTSTTEQHMDRQLKSIRDYCDGHSIKLFKNKIYQDQQTGKNFDRPEYQLMKEVLNDGDCLIISELDRLGRSKKGIMEELRYFQQHEIRVIFLDIPTTQMDLNNLDNKVAQMMIEAINNVLIETFAAMAEAEMEKREKRQREGIQAMKDRGEFDAYGRPRRLTKEKFASLYEKEVEGGLKTPYQQMKELELPKGTYYRYRTEYLQNKISTG